MYKQVLDKKRRKFVSRVFVHPDCADVDSYDGNTTTKNTLLCYHRDNTYDTCEYTMKALCRPERYSVDADMLFFRCPYNYKAECYDPSNNIGVQFVKIQNKQEKDIVINMI